MSNPESEIQDHQPRALNPRHHPSARFGHRRICQAGYRFLGRVDVGALFIAAVLLLAALGSCFPQIPTAIANDPERLIRWEESVRDRYGALTPWLRASGVFRHFRSPVFLVPLALLAVATLVCTLHRWRGTWRRAFHQPTRGSGAALEDAPHKAYLAARSDVDMAEAVRECLRQRGFKVSTTEVITTDSPTLYLRGDRHRPASAATMVTHLAVLLLLLGAGLSGWCGWREEITIGPDDAVEVGRGTGLTLRNEGFTITRYPNGSVAGYEADVAVAVEGREVARGGARTGEPLIYGPVGLHLRSYAEAEGRYSVTLLAVHDPGYGVVIAGGFLLLLGMTVRFNFPYCRVHARIEQDKGLHLAGRAGRRAWDFDHEFETLVEEVRDMVDSA